MKTQVIQLDPHDDVISIRDKMSWTKTGRILLVFPRRKRLRLRNLDLRLLQRHAVLLGAQLAFVSRSGDLRRIAREEGIPAFRVVSVAQRKIWEKPAPAEKTLRQSPLPDLWKMRGELYSTKTGWQNLPAVRIVFFTAAVVTVLVLLFLFLPSATIHLTPTTRLKNLTIPVSASPSVETVNLTGTIPARSITTFSERSRTARASGLASIPDATAIGKVRFTNLTNEKILIPAGTIVRTTGSSPVRFKTLFELTVTTGAGKSQDVSVLALTGGSSGNLPADSLVSIEGDLGAGLAVTNPAPTTGGTDRRVLAPTAADRARLREALLAEILSQCKDSFEATVAAGSLFFPDTLKVSQVASETYIPAEHQTGDTLSLTMNVQCQMQYASAEDIHALAEMGMDVNIPEGFEAVPQGTIASVADTPKTDADGTTHWKIQAQRFLRAQVEQTSAMELAQGRSLAGAALRLSAGLPLEASPDIKVKPSWWPWLPVFPFRISVSIGG